MQITEKLNKMFIKTFDLPIKIYQEPYFTSRLILFDPFFDTIKKYASFKQDLDQFGSQDGYMASYQRLQDTMINDIKENLAYIRFNQMNMDLYRITNTGLPGKTIYKADNDQKTFLSIDLKQANFNALKHFDPMIFCGHVLWEDFVRFYITKLGLNPVSHWEKSKHLRQIIMGHCNPKRQITYEKHIMDQLLTDLRPRLSIKPTDIAFFSNDEIVLYMNDNDDAQDMIQMIQAIAMAHGLPVKTELFTLHKIPGTGGYYKHNLITQAITFKALSYYEFPFVIRRFLNQPIKDQDKVFYYEGHLAQFLDNIIE